MVEIPCDRQSVPQSSKQGNDGVLEFLRSIDMEDLLPKLLEAGMDNKFLVEFRGWTEKAAGELLDDLVNAGVMNRIQAFKFRKALCRQYEGL
jgi:hypothetical protein